MSSSPFKIKELAKEKEIPKEKELQKEKDDLKSGKPEKDKHEKEKHEKEKHEKETKEGKDVKDKQEKEKHEKEKHEKEAHKPEKHETKNEKIEFKEPKGEKIEIKETAKPEKLELEKQTDVQPVPGGGDPSAMAAASLSSAVSPAPTAQLPKLFKEFFKEFQKEFIKEWKEHKPEKLEFEVFVPVGPPIPDLGPVFSGGGVIEARMASLEAAMAQLMHFIPESMRPNLTKGALKNEETGGQAPPAPEP